MLKKICYFLSCMLFLILILGCESNDAKQMEKDNDFVVKTSIGEIIKYDAGKTLEVYDGNLAELDLYMIDINKSEDTRKSDIVLLMKKMNENKINELILNNLDGSENFYLIKKYEKSYKLIIYRQNKKNTIIMSCNIKNEKCKKNEQYLKWMK